MKLDAGQRNLLRLAQRDGPKGDDGWVRVSDTVWPLVSKMPGDLLELRNDDTGKFARITEKGETVLAYT